MATPWKTIRVFISSTFRDMHAERNYLVRLVFPELRERCAKRRLHLIDVDLRWGVTEEESEQGKVLELCLDEIERCRPYFIGLLGERYGWVPSRYEVSDDPRYDWVRQFEPGHSITAIEICHGVLRNPAMRQRAFFYFRNSAFISDIPGPQRLDFLSENEWAQARLERLKRDIREHHVVRENYACAWGGVDSQGKALLTGLEDFGQQVLEDLWSSIDAENPSDEQPADAIALERAFHEAFVEARSRQFIGREDLLARLGSYCSGEEMTPLVVTGAPGSGKSALLARFAKQYATDHPDVFVLPHFIGVSPGSTDIRRTLLRVCRELGQRFQLTEEIPEDYHELRKRLPVLLEQSCSQSKIVLILDGLNQLDASQLSHELHWLPQTAAAGLRLIVSTLEGDCLDALHRRAPRPQEMAVGALLEVERREIIATGLGAYRKQLDVHQMDQLLAKRESASPLYLMVACEELRVFGEFERVNERVASLPGDVEELLQQVIGRLEQDHGRELVESALSLLECSRRGLLENEMLDLLKRHGEDRLPQAIWSRLYRSLQFYLRPPDERGEGALDFFHRQLSKAVKARYLESDNRRVAGHRRLSALFATKAQPRGDGQWAGAYPRSLSELPYHLLEARRCEELFQTARDERFLNEQGRAFPDEPDAALRTIQLAIEGASRNEDPSAMVEFVLAHARSVAVSAEQSPLDALHTGNIERAWKVADMLDAERCALLYLLLAWELRDLNRIEDARTTLARLSRKELPYLSGSMTDHVVGVICQLTKLDEDNCERLWARLLNEFDRRVLCGRLMKDSQFAAAVRIAKSIETPSERARLLEEAANAQAKEGEFSSAAETAGCIEVARNKSGALSAIAVSLAESGDLERARRTADQVEDPSALVRARVAIARAEGSVGLAQEALASIGVAVQTAGAIQDAHLRALGLRNVAALQAERGDFPAARLLLREALATLRSEREDRIGRTLILDRIAEALIEAGESQLAIDLALESDRLSNEALNKHGAQTRKSIEEGKHWTKALHRIATALAERGEFALALRAAESITPDWVRLVVLAKIGCARAVKGDVAGARATFERATETASGLSAGLKRASALNTISVSQLEAGDTEAGRHSFAAAMHQVSAPESVTNKREVEDAITQIIKSQADKGQIDCALEAAELLPEPSTGVILLIGVAKDRFRAGDAEDARLSFEAARQAARSIDDDESRAQALISISRAEEDPGKQLTEADQLKIALQHSRRTDFSYWRDQAATTIVETQAGTGDVAGALKTNARFEELTRKSSDDAWAAIAIAQAKAGNAVGAIQAVRRIAGWRQCHTAVDVAKLLAEENDLENARAALDLASEIAEQSQSDERTYVEFARQNLFGSPDDDFKKAFTAPASIRTQVFCKAARAYWWRGQIELARESLAVAKQHAYGVEHSNPQILLTLAAAQKELHEDDDAVVETLRAAAEAARADSDTWLRGYNLSKIAVEQAGVDDALGALECVRWLEQDDEESTGRDRAFNLDNALRPLCEAQARAGDTQGAIRSARGISKWLDQLRALVAVAVVRAGAGDGQSANSCFEAAVEVVSQDAAPFDSDLALRALAVGRAEAGERLRSHEFLRQALDDARRIESLKERVTALRSLGEALAKIENTDAARNTFREAVEAACRIDYWYRAEPLGEIALAQARSGEWETAVANVIGFDASEESRVKMLFDIALLAAQTNAGDQALKVADAILTERNARLPELAARFADKNDREHFKRLLTPCAYFTDAAYQMCGLLAKLYPESAGAIGMVLAAALESEQARQP